MTDEDIENLHKELKKEIAEKKAEVEEATGNRWSEVSHTDKAYYIAYCRAGELTSKAVKATSDYYKLNVPLEADYVIGRDWSETH